MKLSATCKAACKALAPIDSELQNRVIGKEGLIDCRPADLLKPEFESLRQEICHLAKNDEDVLSYALFPEVGRQFLEQRSTGNLVPEALELESKKDDGVKKKRPLNSM